MHADVGSPFYAFELTIQKSFCHFVGFLLSSLNICHSCVPRRAFFTFEIADITFCVFASSREECFLSSLDYCVRSEDISSCQPLRKLNCTQSFSQLFGMFNSKTGRKRKYGRKNDLRYRRRSGFQTTCQKCSMSVCSPSKDGTRMPGRNPDRHHPEGDPQGAGVPAL